MERARYQRIKRIVLGAEDLRGEARRRFLDEACGTDAGLRADVERLLVPDVEETAEFTLPIERLRPPATRVPPLVGSYVVGDEIGRGGMGVVHAGHDPATGRDVALKFVLSGLLLDEDLRARFAQEVELGRRVVHPNVVRTLGVMTAEAGGRAADVLVMERVRGESLRDVLERYGVVPEALLREVALQVSEGLAAIHAEDIVHRDVKPENVLLTDDQRVRIMDLGIAKLRAATTGLTRRGQFVGSLGYAAPEQFRDAPVGPPADLYALGVLLYEMATGTNPFARSGSAAASMAAHLGPRPEPVHRRRTEVSAFFGSVIQTLLSREPEDRFRSAGHLAQVLRAGEAGAWWRRKQADRPLTPRTLPRIDVDRPCGLHGRGADLAVLRAAWEEAREGAGGVAFLEGEPGIGKTRLLDALLRDVTEGVETSPIVLYGSFSAAGRGGGSAPDGLRGLVDALRGAFEGLPLDRAVSELLQMDAERARPFLALLDGSPAGGELLLHEGALSTACCRILRSLAADRPVLWIVDDVQSASSRARAALLAMARAIRGLPALLVVASRDAPTAATFPEIQRLPGFRRHALRRLSPKEIVELLEDALGSETIADRLGARIARKSDGVPYFVFEMIRALHDEGCLQREDSGAYYLTRSITDVDVPSGVRELMTGRLDDLTREERETLDVAAVIGPRFDPRVLARVLERPLVRVLQDLAELERRRGIVRSEGRGYRFDQHPFVDVIYEELPDPLRAEYHALVAEHPPADDAAEPGRLAVWTAHHHLRGSRPEEALPHFEDAVAFLSHSPRTDEAVTLLERALAIPGLVDDGRRLETHLVLTEILDLLGRRDEQYDHAQKALERAVALDDAHARARAHMALGAHAFAVNDSGESVVQMTDASRLFHASGDEERALDADMRRANSLLRSRRVDEARDIVLDTTRRAEELGDLRQRGLAQRILGMLHVYELDYVAALGPQDRARKLLEEAGDLRSAGTAHAQWGGSCWLLGQVENAQEGFARCLEIARSTQDRYLEINARGRLGLISLFRGRLAEARRQFRHHRDGGVEVGDAAAVGQALANLAQTDAILGQYESALDAARRAADVGVGVENPRLVAFGYTMAGAVQRQMGDPEGARESLEQAMAAARDVGDRYLIGAALVEESKQRELAGDPSAALERAREALELSIETKNDRLCASAELRLAALGERSGEDVRAEHADAIAQLAVHERLTFAYGFHECTGDAALLDEARDLLQRLAQHAPPECVDSLRRRVPIHRAVLAASSLRS